MALGRGVSQNQRTSPLPLACSRSGWRSVGYSGPEPEGQEGSQEVLSQALKGITVCPECDHTDKLRSYGAAKAEALPRVDHCKANGQNHRTENSNQPTRL